MRVRATTSGIRRFAIHQSHRKGWMLIELTMVITVSAILIGLAVKLIGGLMGAQSRAGELLFQEDARTRFAAQLRDDVHAAIDVLISDDMQTCRLVSPRQGEVRYEITPDGILRTSENATPALRNLFRVGSNSGQFEFDREQGLVRAVLKSQPAANRGALVLDSQVNDVIDAALGIHQAAEVSGVGDSP